MKFKTTEELKHVPFEMYARVLARAEQAEAQLAEAKAELASNKLVIDQLAHERNDTQAALEEATARAERAEAELKRVPLWIAGHGYATGHGDAVEDMLAELVADVKERAKAERDVMREALEPFAKIGKSIRPQSPDDDGIEIVVSCGNLRKARAALAPSPAGREG